VSALSLALEDKNFIFISPIIKHIKQNPTYDNFSLLNGNLPSLNRLELPDLVHIYEKSLRKTTDAFPSYATLIKDKYFKLLESRLPEIEHFA
jgi:hypothetical protein